jgi:hypothetical protein
MSLALLVFDTPGRSTVASPHSSEAPAPLPDDLIDTSIEEAADAKIDTGLLLARLTPERRDLVRLLFGLPGVEWHDSSHPLNFVQAGQLIGLRYGEAPYSERTMKRWYRDIMAAWRASNIGRAA